jgi:hypothetical protein
VTEFSLNWLWILLIIGLSHVTIDFFKRRFRKKAFVIDQILHIALIIIVWAFWGRGIQVRPFIEYIFAYLPNNFPKIILGLLCILRPIGALIESGDIWTFGKDMHGSSRMIGYLERLIVFFLILFGQISAIAFVIAAKSIARFPEIGKKESGGLKAEYYIIGTLLSFISVFAISFLLGIISV